MSDTRTETRGWRSIPADKLAALYEAERERDTLRQLVNEGTMPFVRSQTTDDEEPTFEQQVLGALMRIDRLGQDYYSRSINPLAGTGGGYLNQAIGLAEASNVLRPLLGMPRHPGFRRDQ